MMKHKVMSALALVSVLSLVGCAKNPEKDIIKNEIMEYKESDTSVSGKLGERIVIDAEIQSRPREDSYEVIRCKTDDTDYKELYREVFFSEKEREKLVKWDFGRKYEDGSCFVSWGEGCDDGNLVYDETGEPWSPHNIAGRPDNSFSYTQDYYQNLVRTYLFFDERFREYDTDRYWVEKPEKLLIDEKTELTNYSQSEAIADGQKLFSDLGIEVCEKPQVMYAICRNDWEEVYKDVLELLKEEVEEETDKKLENDEFYYMIWLDELNGIPVVTGNRSSGNQGAKGIREYPEDGVYNEIFMSKSGILDFNRSSARYKETGRDEKQDIISLQEAIIRLDEYYSNTLMQTDHILYRVNFCYVPTKIGDEEKMIQLSDGNEYGYMVYDVDMIPAWCLEVRYQGRVDDPEDIWNEMIYVNAQTGEFIQ